MKPTPAAIAEAITWAVGTGFDRAIDELKANGVVFERYDMPGVSRSGDVHEAGGMKLAWFKDPDGNIIHVNSAGR